MLVTRTVCQYQNKSLNAFFIGEQESIYAEILLSNPRQIQRKITDDGDFGALDQVCKIGYAEWKPVDQEEELKDCDQVEKK